MTWPIGNGSKRQLRPALKLGSTRRAGKSYGIFFLFFTNLTGCLAQMKPLFLSPEFPGNRDGPGWVGSIRLPDIHVTSTQPVSFWLRARTRGARPYVLTITHELMLENTNVTNASFSTFSSFLLGLMVEYWTQLKFTF